MNLNKKIEYERGDSVEEIQSWQDTHKINIPSDYEYVLQKLNGLRINDGHSYVIENGLGDPIVEFDDFIMLQHLEGELPLIRKIEEEDNIEILSKYCPFARTVSKIILLMGNCEGNLNEIFLWNYEFYNDPESPERLHKIANNFEDLINNKLRKIEH